jgi:integrase/recombinase XerD
MIGPFHAATGDSVALPSSLDELAAEYHADAVGVRGVLESSAAAERPYLKRFFEWFGPPNSPADLFGAIDTDSIIECLIDYASKHGPGSRGCMQNTVRLFLRFGYRVGYLGRDLSSLSPSVRSPRMGRIAGAIPPGCVEALLASMQGDTPADMRDRAIVCLLSTYGVRGVQVRCLRLVDVDWPRSRIQFAAVKGGRAVEQHLTDDAGNRLADYLCKGRTQSPHPEVFLHTRAPFGPITHPRELSRILRRRLEQADVELPTGVRYGSHGFRHAFAARMYGRVPFKDVVDMLGHRDPSTTLIYGKIDLVALRKAAVPWPGGTP